MLRHPNIVKVEDLITIEQKCAVVMEFLDGIDLKTLITFANDKEVLCLFESHWTLCSLSPEHLKQHTTDPLVKTIKIHWISFIVISNRPILCLIIDGEVKVLDFGTARATFGTREAQTQALAFGSQAYMAPERMLQEEDTFYGDVFSLAVTFMKF